MKRPVPWLTLAVTCSLALLAPQVQAARRNVELQLIADKLITLVRQRLMQGAETLCGVTLPLFNRQYVLDHIEFSSSGARLDREAQTTAWPPADPNTPGSVPGPYQIRRLQVVIPVTLVLKDQACLENPTCPPDRYDVELFFNLSAAGANICVTLSRVTYLDQELPIGLFPPALRQGFCNTLNLAGINRFIGNNRVVTNTGVSADQGLTRIAFRVEFDGPTAPPDPAWTQFFLGYLSPGLDVTSFPDWAVFIDKDLVIAQRVSQLTQQLVNDDRVQLQSDPTGYWTGMGTNGAGLTMSFAADIDTGLDSEVCDTIGLDPATVTSHLSVTSNVPDILSVDSVLTYDTDFWDLVECSGLAGFAPPAVTSLAIIAAFYEHDLTDLNAGVGCTWLTDTQVVCARPVEMPDISLGTGLGLTGTLTVHEMFGHSLGAVFGGLCRIPVRPYIPLMVSSNGFEYGVHGDCRTPNGWTQGDPYIGYRCVVNMSGTGILCQDIQIIQDPLGMFALHQEPRIGEGFSAAEFEIKFPMIPDDPNSNHDPYDQYFHPTTLQGQNSNNWTPPANYRYPCRLRIRTSVGSRIFEIPAPVEGHPSGYTNELLRAIDNCVPPQFIDPFGRQRFGGLWHTDPAVIDVFINILKDDPAESPQVVTGQLTGVGIIFDGTPTGNKTPESSYEIPTAAITVQGNLTTDICDFIPCGGDATSSAKSAKSGKQVAHDPQVIPISIPMTADMVGWTIGDDTTAEFAFARTVSATGQLPEDQLPDGVRAASFQFDLDPAAITFVGKLDEPFREAQPVAAAGFCGAGTGATMALTLLGLAFVQMARPRPRRSPKRSLRA